MKIYAKTKDSFVILIDEYDVPIQSGYLNGYYPEIISFIKNLFGNALKTNDNFSGYSAGTARNLKEFLSNIPNEYNINGLLTAAINTTKDSLNTASAKEAISGKLASLIAFYLFDDYVTLGN